MKNLCRGWAGYPLTNLPSWTAYTLEHDSLDLAPGGQPLPQTTMPGSAVELLQIFDGNVATARALIAGTSDQDFMKMWQLQRNGVTLLTLPKIAVLRGFVLNHNIHHRAQLGVYLRLNDIPVPSIYGHSPTRIRSRMELLRRVRI